MAVSSLPFSRLSLVPSSSHSPNSLRLSSSQSFASSSLTYVDCSKGFASLELRRRPLVVAAAAPPQKKKADSAVKRARQAEKNRLYNKSRKSEIQTRMKKVFVALEGLKKETNAASEMILPIETLISEAFSTIDKAVQVGTLHKNTGSRRKSRLSRAKQTLEKAMGWYAPSPTASA